MNLEQTIDNCLYYISVNDKPECIYCISGYYMKNNECLETPIRNCLEFES